MNNICETCLNLDCNKNGLYCMCGQPIYEIGDECSYYEFNDEFDDELLT